MEYLSKASDTVFTWGPIKIWLDWFNSQHNLFLQVSDLDKPLLLEWLWYFCWHFFFLLKNAVSSKPECFMETLSILERTWLGRFFQVQREWIFFLSFLFHENFQKVSFLFHIGTKTNFKALKCLAKWNCCFPASPIQYAFLFMYLQC